MSQQEDVTTATSNDSHDSNTADTMKQTTQQTNQEDGSHGATNNHNTSPVSSSAPSLSTQSSSSLAGDGDNAVANAMTVTFLLITGDKYVSTFAPEDTVLHAKEMLMGEWPKNFGMQPETVSCLRLLYMGHFLDDSATLRESKLQLGENTTVHLMIRTNDTPEKEGKYYIKIFYTFCIRLF